MSPHKEQIIRWLAVIPAFLTILVLALPAPSQAARQRIPETGDWLTAVRVVQSAYPGSSQWLISCSAGEGGHGLWVPNRLGSGAGGWLQYMEGTFWTDFSQARRDLVARGFLVPASAASWHSALGQALAGGWAYGHARWRGKWLGRGC